MNDSENNIRDYLKTFTVEEIADSVYLFGINFDTAPIEDIMGALSSLYEEAKSLRGIVDRNFESLEGERLPKDPEHQSIVIQQCYQKESALQKALSNKDVYQAFVEYKAKEMAKVAGQSK